MLKFSVETRKLQDQQDSKIDSIMDVDVSVRLMLMENDVYLEISAL